jgi:hypothetical protein
LRSKEYWGDIKRNHESSDSEDKEHTPDREDKGGARKPGSLFGIMKKVSRKSHEG